MCLCILGKDRTRICPCKFAFGIAELFIALTNHDHDLIFLIFHKTVILHEELIIELTTVDSVLISINRPRLQSCLLIISSVVVLIIGSVEYVKIEVVGGHILTTYRCVYFRLLESEIHQKSTSPNFHRTSRRVFIFTNIIMR